MSLKFNRNSFRKYELLRLNIKMAFNIYEKKVAWRTESYAIYA